MIDVVAVVVVDVTTTCWNGHPGILFSIAKDAEVRAPTVNDTTFTTKLIGSSGIDFMSRMLLFAIGTRMDILSRTTILETESMRPTIGHVTSLRGSRFTSTSGGIASRSVVVVGGGSGRG